MERRMLIIAAAASSLMLLAEERRYSMSERVRIDDDDDVFDRMFGDRTGDYIVDYGLAYDFPYGRLDREELKVTPDFFLADRPVPDYGSLRAQIGTRIPGPQVLSHRRPVRRHA